MKLPDKKKLQALTRRPVERENDDSAKMAVMHPVQHWVNMNDLWDGIWILRHWIHDIVEMFLFQWPFLSYRIFGGTRQFFARDESAGRARHGPEQGTGQREIPLLFCRLAPPPLSSTS